MQVFRTAPAGGAEAQSPEPKSIHRNSDVASTDVENGKQCYHTQTMPEITLYEYTQVKYGLEVLNNTAAV